MNLYEQNSVYDAAGTPLNNKYNNKELQESGFYDYGWRQYMPDLGRWFGMDKLSETYASFSPYAYVMNNPVMMFDPDGRVSANFFDNIWNSPSGTTWYNTGSGFSSSSGLSMDYDGNSINWSSGYVGVLLGGAGVSYNPAGGLSFNSGGSSDDNLPTINVPEVILKGNKSTWGQQILDNFDAFMEQLNVDNELAFNAMPYEPSFIRDFAEGFKYAPESNLSAPSSWLGTAGLSMSQYEGLLAKTAKIAPIRYANISSQGLKYLKPLGKTLGLVGAAITAFEGMSDGNGFTSGDMVKVGISVVTVFTPYGWIYGAVDLGVGMATGTTLTDRIGAGIDNTILGR